MYFIITYIITMTIDNKVFRSKVIKALRALRHISVGQAIRLQVQASALIIQQPLGGNRIKLIAGVDVSVKGGMVRAAIVTMNMDGFEIVETQTAQRRLEFPYIPGLLAFREAPVLMQAFRKLRSVPDVALVDGHGLCHPRLFGLACHMGLAWDIPTIGVAKSRLVGAGPEPGEQKGAWAPLEFQGQVVARVLRSRERVKPIFISVGHRVDLPTAMEVVLRSLTRYRLPEPIRAAHKAAAL